MTNNRYMTAATFIAGAALALTIACTVPPEQPAPEPPFVNDISEEGHPAGPLDTWDEDTLECGTKAMPAIDQDEHGNWWAYCEPALVD